MKKSFRDPVTGVLKAWGFADSNAPGDLVRDEPEDFNLEPGKWRLVDRDWVSYIPPTRIPSEVPMASARVILLRNGITDTSVKNAIATSLSTDSEKAEALIDWEFRTVVRRASPLVSVLGPALGLSETQIDDMFIAAGELP